jgi:hypothetical protein
MGVVDRVVRPEWARRNLDTMQRPSLDSHLSDARSSFVDRARYHEMGRDLEGALADQARHAESAGRGRLYLGGIGAGAAGAGLTAGGTGL